jgi:hypothetical protein
MMVKEVPASEKKDQGEQEDEREITVLYMRQEKIQG